MAQESCKQEYPVTVDCHERKSDAQENIQVGYEPKRCAGDSWALPESVMHRHDEEAPETNSKEYSLQAPLLSLRLRMVVWMPGRCLTDAWL